MIKKQEFQKEGSGFGQRNHYERGPAHEPQQAGEAGQVKENYQGKEAGQVRDNNQPRDNQTRDVGHYRDNAQARNPGTQKDYVQTRDSQQTRGFHRDIQSRHPGVSSYQSHIPKLNKIKIDETIDDIKQDIVRIEKEIDLEIKEIKSMKLGL